MKAELDRTLEFPPRLPSKKRKHHDHPYNSSSHHKSSRTVAMSSHAHCCCPGAGSHTGSHAGPYTEYHPAQAPSQSFSNRHSRNYSPNTGCAHKHARTSIQIPHGFHHQQEKPSLGKYSHPPPLFHTLKNFLDPRLIRSNSTRYASHCIGTQQNHHLLQRDILTNIHLSTRQAPPSPLKIRAIVELCSS